MKKDVVLGNHYTPYPLRISEELMAKVKFIARDNKRSGNKQLEFIIEEFVKSYEEKHGEIITEI